MSSPRSGRETPRSRADTRTARILCRAAVALILLLPALSAPCACGKGREDAVKSAFAGYRGRHVLFVSKAERRLYVYDRNCAVVAFYKIAYGLNPDGKNKLHAGDNRTPEGRYTIIEILSMDASPDTAAYKKLKRMNEIYFRARDGHYKYGRPSVDLGDNAYGPRYYLLDYPNGDDRLRYEKALRRGLVPMRRGAYESIGSGIAIHGNNDEASIGHLASSGCVRMYNLDIIDLEKYIQIRTPVIISAR